MPADSTAPVVVYKPVPNFPGYRVGSDGTVWTCRLNLGHGNYVNSSCWRQRKPCVDKKGYLYLQLRKDGKIYRFFVHQLVLLAFVGPCPPGHEAAHDPDPNPANCRADNLKWKTHKDNMADRRKQGTHCEGEYHGSAKLKEADVRYIRENPKALTQRQLAEEKGVQQGLISMIRNRKIWRNI